MIIDVKPKAVKVVASEEYKRFTNALQQVLTVSKSDLNRMLAAEKTANAGKPKRGPKPKTSDSASAADHASVDRD